MSVIHKRIGLVAVMVLAGLVAALMVIPAAAQEPGDSIEDLALRAHRQNVRTGNYTFWIGGNLGDPLDAPARTPLGERGDDWLLRGFAGDDDVSTAELERPALLNFWASWCGPCRVEFPHLVSVALAPEDHAFDVVFVNQADEERDAMAFLADQPRAITNTIDQNDRYARRASVNSIPTSLLLDSDGTVLAVHVGILTPTVTDFLDAVAANPGEGTFLAAEHLDETPTADLLPVDVDEAALLTFGEGARGTLSDADFQHAYRFEGSAGDIINLELQAADSDLDAYLVLMAADGARLAEDDDGGLGTDSAIVATLPADGTYLVIATRYLEADGFSSGDYVLLGTRQAGAPGPAQQDDGDGLLAYGETVQDRVSGNDPRRFYGFEGQAGDVITVRVTHEPGTAPLRVEIKDPHLDRLAVSEWSQDGEAALVDIALPEDGLYRLTVWRERANETTYAGFTLALGAEGIAPAPPVDAEPLPQDGPPDNSIAYGQTVSGMIDDDRPEERWTFTGQRGDVIRATMTRAVDELGGLDGYLLLEGPDGTVLAEVDDTVTGVMPVLEDITLPEDGAYTLVATRFGFANGFSSGAYSLLLERTGTSTIATPGEAGAGIRWIDPENLPADLQWLAYNDSAGGMITGDDLDDWYLFRGRAGDVVTLRMEAEDDTAPLDPFLILTDGGGYELARNDDAGADTLDAALLDFELPADGSYLVRATRYGFEHGTSSGAYTLTLSSEAEPLDTVEAGAVTELAPLQLVTGALSLPAPRNRYTFEGGAGQQVTIAAEPIPPDALSLVLTVTGPDGAEIASTTVESEVGARINRLALPANGTYTLDVALEDLNDAGEYRLLLLTGPAPEIAPGAFTPAEGPEVEVVLVWAGEADLDLETNLLDFSAVRANDWCQETTPAPVEQLAWPSPLTQPGTFLVTVRYRFDCAGTGQPVPFTLAIVIRGEIVDLVSGTLTRVGDTYTTQPYYTAPEE